MKRTLLLCAVSAVLGGVFAIAWERGPSVEKKSMAQEPVPVIPQPGIVRPGAPMIGNAPQGFAPPMVAPPAADPRMGQEFTAEERVNIWVYEQANRAVVNITTKGYQGERVLMFQVQSEGEGSGVVLDQQGHIVTNYHVVEGAKQIQVTLYDGVTYDAKVVGQDPSSDVAVIKIELSRQLPCSRWPSAIQPICTSGSACSPSAIRSGSNARSRPALYPA